MASETIRQRSYIVRTVIRNGFKTVEYWTFAPRIIASLDIYVPRKMRLWRIAYLLYVLKILKLITIHFVKSIDRINNFF